MPDEPKILVEGTTIEADPKRGLVRKLCEVMRAVGYLQKKGENRAQGQGYKYVKEADVVAAVRDEFAKRCLFVFPSLVTQGRSKLERMNFQGEVKTTYATDLVMRWTVVDGETGQERTCDIPGSSETPGDKGVYVAMTGSEKYFLMKSLLLPTGDDPEDDANEEPKTTHPPSPKKVTAPPKPVLDANSKARNDDNSSKPLPPKAEIPPATAAPSAKPDRDQFQAYVTRVKDVIKVNLEEAGLKPSEDGKVTTGAKLQKYILSRSPGAKALTDLSIADWETFFGQVESETTYRDVIAKIEDHYKMEALKKL